MAVKLLIDSASDINEKEAKELGVVMIPMTINFGEEEYLDGVDLLPNKFYEKLTNGSVMPKTSQINAYRFEEEFERYTKNGDELVVITISSKLSGTYNSACQAASKFEGKVHVVDSMNACAGERVLGMYALELIKSGKSAREIATILNERKSDIIVTAVIDTLKYLKKGGRISSVAAFAGEMLALKPIAAIVDGEVKVVGKAMGLKKAFMSLNKYVVDNGGIDLTMPNCALWSGIDKTNLQKYLENDAKVWDNGVENVPTYPLGGTIGTHIGPGAVGLAFFRKK